MGRAISRRRSREQQDLLLNRRLVDDINDGAFAAKGTELRDGIAQLTLQLEVADRTRGKQTDRATLLTFSLGGWKSYSGRLDSN